MRNINVVFGIDLDVITEKLQAAMDLPRFATPF